MKCFTGSIHKTNGVVCHPACSACRILKMFEGKFTDEDHAQLEVLMGNVLRNAYIKGVSDGVDVMTKAARTIAGSSRSVGRSRQEPESDIFFNVATCGLGALLP